MELSQPASATIEPATAAPATTPSVDQDALEWARQAYARLKAQQQAAAAAAEPAPAQPAAVPAPPAPAPGAAPASAASPTPEQAPPPQPLPEQVPTEPLGPSAPAIDVAQVLPPQEASASTPTDADGSVTAPSASAPSASASFEEPDVAAASPDSSPSSPAPQPSPAPAAGLSLLEQAAAQRRQRQQELIAIAELADTGSAPAPSETSTSTSTSVSGSGSGSPAAAPAQPSPLADAAEPSLGAFDDTFTWSAEVLAAQGRQLDDISLEEIDWLGRLRRGLEKTRRGFVTQLLDRLGDDPLTPEVLDDFETTLLRADVGVQATDQVLEALRQRLNEEVVDPAEGIRFLKEQLRGLLDEPITASGVPLLAPERERLNVWLMVGVNGVGKTTTLGKLANLAVRSGYSCLIAAADTFRAAAVQQVQIWGDRSGVAVIANPSANADPAAVVYDAIGAAQSKGTELVLVDTAGRLQTKHNLMEELAKVRRIIDKLAPDAAVESLLVLDASQGQNGLRQAMAFAKAAGLTGVVLTKLDGSARGGVAIAVAHEAGLPIRFIGAGEGIRDLRPFNSFEFVEALLAV
ncbi:signal recognition particle-docking protein FtsY [Synechococcus sp. CS-1328]|uniref:signal recognition particle-docking protein FtsY n=1 Tax=Synechococcus sp. CS-1328 TaxID=2847976 RepID=UPI0037D9DD8B